MKLLYVSFWVLAIAGLFKGVLAVTFFALALIPFLSYADRQLNKRIAEAEAIKEAEQAVTDSAKPNTAEQ